ncbi:MAG: sigma-E processing peptidase SpoIIGA [Lachnospiraceae bacterium]|nr:sigma-E processing peptidase SpoIIGA [Lachnospiraceae bacterium]
MYYEVYLDSLFLLNFTMNLYLLLLVNKSLHRTATRFRLFLGAVIGGAGYCLMFVLPVGIVPKVAAASLCAGAGMLIFVFKPSTIKAFFQILERMLMYALLMGGGFLLLRNHIKPFRTHMIPIMGMLASGGILMLIFYRETGRREQEKQELLEVRLLTRSGFRMTVKAIVDTGNSLKEPISGKPVSVLDRETFEILWQNEDREKGFRAIPYRSVGCEGGIMNGYELPEITFELGGIKKSCRGIYIGVSEQAVSATQNYQMLLHPKLLEE